MSKPLSRKYMEEEQEEEDHGSDNGSVTAAAPKSKKQRKNDGGSNGGKANGGGVGGVVMQTDEEGQEYWEISGKRRLQISRFKGNTFVNIREFYEKDGKALPGKKGISLSVDQYAAVVELLPDIERVLEGKGVSVPRPRYDGPVAEGNGDALANDDDGEEDEERGAPKRKKAKAKMNHEATSDEDEAGD